MARVVFLLVFPNPFAALDSDGEPAAVLPRVDLPGALVGARVDHERSRDGALKYFFDLSQPVQLPDLPAYRAALRSGDLLPANEATARLVGRPFVAPPDALREAEERAAARWRAETGEDPPFVVKEREGAALDEPRTEIAMETTPDGQAGELTESPGVQAGEPTLPPPNPTAPASPSKARASKARPAHEAPPGAASASSSSPPTSPGAASGSPGAASTTPPSAPSSASPGAASPIAAPPSSPSTSPAS
jgi:hypothetical protein